MTIVEANDESFTKEVLQSSTPVVVEFSKTGVNQYTDPKSGQVTEQPNNSSRTKDILDGLSADYSNKVKFVRVDLDSNPQSAKLCGVTEAPALLFIQRAPEFHLKFWIKKRIDAMLE
jgi:thioredoxin 1